MDSCASVNGDRCSHRFVDESGHGNLSDGVLGGHGGETASAFPQECRKDPMAPWAHRRKAAFMPAIVCGINDSPGALEALRVARTLSAQFDARLVLAHVAGGFAAAVDESLTTGQARKGGAMILERAAREHDLQAEHRLEVGEPAEGLARIASEEAASLIVVGSSRQGRLRPRLRSTLAGTLAAAAPCPVVIVPPAGRR
jgi:nucleotide-binding universal stress UspA family protein